MPLRFADHYVLSCSKKNLQIIKTNSCTATSLNNSFGSQCQVISWEQNIRQVPTRTWTNDFMLQGHPEKFYLAIGTYIQWLHLNAWNYQFMNSWTSKTKNIFKQVLKSIRLRSLSLARSMTGLTDLTRHYWPQMNSGTTRSPSLIGALN